MEKNELKKYKNILKQGEYTGSFPYTQNRADDNLSSVK